MEALKILWDGLTGKVGDWFYAFVDKVRDNPVRVVMFLFVLFAIVLVFIWLW